MNKLDKELQRSARRIGVLVIALLMVIWYAYPPMKIAAVTDTDSVLQCSWIDRFDANGHWRECQNHHDTGDYNGVWHYDGRDTNGVTPHNYRVTTEQACDHEGIQTCTVCGYQETLPALPHTPGEGYQQGYNLYEISRKICTVCGGNIDLPATFSIRADLSGKTFGTVYCVETGEDWYTLNTKTSAGVCARGGTHEVDDSSFLNRSAGHGESHFHENSGGDALECTKCGQQIVVKPHAVYDSSCKSCGAEIVPEFKWTIEQYTENTITWVVSSPKFSINNPAGAITVTPNGDAQVYANNNDAWPAGNTGTIQDVSTSEEWRFRFTIERTVATTDGQWHWADNTITFFSFRFVSLYLPSGSGGMTSQVQEYDLTPPEINPDAIKNALGLSVYPAMAVDPTGEDDQWSNVGTLTVPRITDSGIGNCQFALYCGEEQLTDWIGVDQTESIGSKGQKTTFAGTYPDWTELTIRARDGLKNTSSYNFSVRHIENEPPDVTHTLSTTDPTPDPVQIQLHGSDAHSGFYRFTIYSDKLEAPITTGDADYTFTARKNGRYYVRAEDQIGNARTVEITVSNIVEVVTVEAEMQPFVIDPNASDGTAQEGSVTLINRNPFPVTVTIDAVTPLSSIPVISHEKYTATEWDTLGVADTADGLALGFQYSGQDLWPAESPASIELPPNSSITLPVISKNGRCFEHPVELQYILHCTID